MARSVVKRTTKRKTSAARKPRAAASRSKNSGDKIINTIVPLFFIVCLSICLCYLVFLGYKTVTASSFFDLEDGRIDIRGQNRVPGDKVRDIVRAKTVDGVWNADIAEIKLEVEKLPNVREAVVSRVLPDGIRVRLEEQNSPQISLNNQK